jgi:sugar lactone lactonase YvrE
MNDRNQRRFALSARALLLVAVIVSYGLFQPASSPAQDAPVKDARYYSQRAAEAYKGKNYSAYLDNMKMALALRPNHPTLMYNLAGAYALVGDREKALNLLSRVADMGLIYPAEKEDDFASLRDMEEFKKILRKFESNKAPTGASKLAFTIGEKGLIPESVAYDPVKEIFYVGSVYQRKILSSDKHGTVREFSRESDGLWSAMGMKVDAGRRHLWVATTAHPQMARFNEAENGESAIFKYDLKSGKLLKKYLVPQDSKKHWLGDLVINSRGDVFATDSLTPAVYTIPHQKDEIEMFISDASFASLQGLDFSENEKQIFVADYSKGIFIIDLATKKISNVAPTNDSMLLGIDGLYFYKDSLIAIQNSAAPHRVVRLFLNKSRQGISHWKIIEANNPAFDEPTLGVLVKDTFYYVANSQWGAIDRKGQFAQPDKLREPIILKTKLSGN